MNASILDNIPGGPELQQWFGGRTPRFHDAEVLSIALERDMASATLRVHTFEMTSEVDDRGHFVCTRHVVVKFELSWISDMELGGFNHQNALDSLSVSHAGEAEVRLELEPAYGLGGFVQAREMKISLEPGIPPGSQYLRLAGGSGA